MLSSKYTIISCRPVFLFNVGLLTEDGASANLHNFRWVVESSDSRLGVNYIVFLDVKRQHGIKKHTNITLGLKL